MDKDYCLPIILGVLNLIILFSAFYWPKKNSYIPEFKDYICPIMSKEAAIWWIFCAFESLMMIILFIYFFYINIDNGIYKNSFINIFILIFSLFIPLFYGRRLILYIKAPKRFAALKEKRRQEYNQEICQVLKEAGQKN